MPDGANVSADPTPPVDPRDPNGGSPSQQTASSFVQSRPDIDRDSLTPRFSLSRPTLYTALVLIIGVAAVLLLGLRYRFLLDDAFISLRYARHLVEGEGLVYNPGGERVEGYTNFLWVLIAAAHFPLTRYPEHFLLLYGRLFGVLLVVGVWWELMKRGAMGRRWLWLGVGLVALHQTVHSWMSGGLETNAFAFLVLITVGRFLREEFQAVTAQRPWSILAMSAALLMRPESYLFWAVLSAVLVVRRMGRAPTAPGGWKRAWIWIASTGIVIAAHVLWRRAYYGEWLPNTFVAKVPGSYFQHGIPYVRLYLSFHYLSWVFALACILVPFLWLIPRWRNPLTGPALTLSVLLIGYLAYVAYVGGDHFEFRLLSPTVPLFALLIPHVFEGVGAAWTKAWWTTPRRPAWLPYVVLVVLGAGVFARQLHTAFAHPYVPYLRAMELETVESFQFFNGVENGYMEGLWLGTYLPPDAAIAFRSAGVVPYVSDVTTIDMLGLNDKTIARVPVRKRGRLFHERWPPPLDYLEQRGVALIESSLYVDSPDQLGKDVLEDNKMIVVKVFTGNWLLYSSPFHPNDVRKKLREQGAIVAPGVNENPEEVERINRANEPEFEKRSQRALEERDRRHRHEHSVLTFGLE